MSKKLIRDLAKALKEAASFECGEKLNLRVTKLPPPPKPLKARDIVQLRKNLNMSQAVFAGYINVTPSTVRSWEQGLRQPGKAALKLLHVARKDPRVLTRV
ncbi:MAG: helix-turn-helix domain-containing protein [Planctomycetes bacterium]|nr:helix-turn-helix domain-containing protein [Planctomycetota bacterium]